MMRALYLCDKCGARFTTDSSLVDNETPHQKYAHAYYVPDHGHDGPAYEHLCEKCFRSMPEYSGVVR